jgi:hypothetical protein
VQTLGVLRFTTRNLAGTAADVIGRLLVKFELATEASS